MLKKTKLIALIAAILAVSAYGCGKDKSNDFVRQSAPQSTAPITTSSPTPSPVTKKVKDNVYLEDVKVGGLTEAELIDVIKSFEPKINTVSKNAQMNLDTWEITNNGNNGKKVDVNATKDLVLSANDGDKAKLTIVEEKPQVTVDSLKANIVEIGECTTEILDQEAGRMKNIELSVKKINTKKIKPGEIFSFNESVGARTSEKGYKVAPIITPGPTGPIKGKEIGGGVCQVSTTIYGAVAKAGLEILERHEHSKDIHYVPKGEDATVSYPSTDFKFKNSKNKPIVIYVKISKNTLVCKIFENRN